MQARNTSGRLTRAGRKPWLLRPLAAAAAASVAAMAAAAPAGAPGSTASGGTAAIPNYRVIQLSPSSAFAEINVKGQVAFTEFSAGTGTRAKFYDGHTVRDLGTLGGPNANVGALNDYGQIAGSATVDAAGEVYHAYRWSKATGMVDLNPPGSGRSFGNAINNRGWVAGAVATAPGRSPLHAFRWTPASGVVDLGSFGNVSSASALNEAGTVVGYSEGPELGILGRAFRWTEAGGLQSLVSISSVASEGLDINEAGKIVGSASFDTSLSDQAFLWTPGGGLQEIGTAPSYLAFAQRINEKGLVTGQYYSAPVDPNGFIWSRDTGLQLIGTPGTDTSNTGDVNNLGQVVGSLNARAFAWTRAAGVVDLNTRIPGAPPELELWQAQAVSDNGSIAAVGNTGLVLLVPSAAYHQAPVAAPIKLTGPTRVHSLLSFSSSFRDVDLRDTHKATWTWGDGASAAGTVSQAAGSGSVSGQYAYRKSGIYTVRLNILDSGGQGTSVERKLTVCGCSSGAVAGEGAFLSPQGASARDTKGGGVARFAFLSEATGTRARQGTALGASEVHFNTGKLNFRSTAVDSVTVDGKRVRYSGSGSVNGVGGYRFTLTALAGAGTAKDRVHMRITHADAHSKAEVVDYDNGLRAGARAASLMAGVGAGTSTAAEGSAVLGDRAVVFGGPSAGSQ